MAHSDICCGLYRGSLYMKKRNTTGAAMLPVGNAEFTVTQEMTTSSSRMRTHTKKSSERARATTLQAQSQDWKLVTPASRQKAWYTPKAQTSKICRRTS